MLKRFIDKLVPKALSKEKRKPNEADRVLPKGHPAAQPAQGATQPVSAEREGCPVPSSGATSEQSGAAELKAGSAQGDALARSATHAPSACHQAEPILVPPVAVCSIPGHRASNELVDGEETQDRLPSTGSSPCDTAPLPPALLRKSRTTEDRSGHGSQSSREFPMHFFAVYDGHGGAGVAQHCSQVLHAHFQDALAKCAGRNPNPFGRDRRAATSELSLPPAGIQQQQQQQRSQSEDTNVLNLSHPAPAGDANLGHRTVQVLDLTAVSPQGTMHQAQGQGTSGYSPAYALRPAAAGHSGVSCLLSTGGYSSSVVVDSSASVSTHPSPLSTLFSSSPANNSSNSNGWTQMTSQQPQQHTDFADSSLVSTLAASAQRHRHQGFGQGGGQLQQPLLAPPSEPHLQASNCVPFQSGGAPNTAPASTLTMAGGPRGSSELYEPLPLFSQPSPVQPPAMAHVSLLYAPRDFSLDAAHAPASAQPARPLEAAAVASTSKDASAVLAAVAEGLAGTPARVAHSSSEPCCDGEHGATHQTGCSVSCLEAALREAFLQTDEDLLQAGGLAKDQGSTAVVALVGPDHVWIANAGDSRAVLCRDGHAVVMSSDHKPSRQDEMLRVQAAGGHVWWNRVMGELAVSRAIGDHLLRPYVIAEPEVYRVSRREGDQLLILASDGLWDVMNCQEACDIALTTLDEHTAKGRSVGTCIRKIANALTTSAMERGSRDNVTVLVVDVRRGGGAAGATADAARSSVSIGRQHSQHSQHSSHSSGSSTSTYEGRHGSPALRSASAGSAAAAKPPAPANVATVLGLKTHAAEHPRAVSESAVPTALAPPNLYTRALSGSTASSPLAPAVASEPTLSAHRAAAPVTATNKPGATSPVAPRELLSLLQQQNTGVVSADGANSSDDSKRAYVNPALRRYLERRMELARAAGRPVAMSVFPLASTPSSVTVGHLRNNISSAQAAAVKAAAAEPSAPGASTAARVPVVSAPECNHVHRCATDGYLWQQINPKEAVLE